jgi:O-antigen ligase
VIRKKSDTFLLIVLSLLSISPLFLFFKSLQSILMILLGVLLLVNFKKISLRYIDYSLIICFLIVCYNNIYYLKDFPTIGESFLLFIVPVLTINKNYIYFIEKYKNKFLLFYTISVAILCFYIIGFYIIDIPNHNFNWYFARFNLEKKINIHGTYSSIWIGIALLITVFQTPIIIKRFNNLQVTITTLLYLSALIITNSRMVAYSLIVIIFLVFIIKNYKSKTKSFKLLWLIIIILIFVGFFSQRYSNDIKYLKHNSITQTTRYKIFISSINSILESPFIGYENSKIQEIINDNYIKLGDKKMAVENLNSHNQYLNFFLKGGFFLFIFFAYTLVVKLITSVNKNNFLYFSVTLLFCFTFLSENVLVRQYGIFIYFFIETLFYNSLLEKKLIVDIK